MTNFNEEGVPSKDSVRQLFGPPPPRRPIPSNSFNALVQIFSCFPDQNPFSDYASYTKLPEYPRWCNGNLNNLKRPISGIMHNDSAVSLVGKQASDKLIGPASVKDLSSSIHNGANSDPNPGVFCEDDSSSALDMLDHDLYKMKKNAKRPKIMDRMGSNEEASNAQIVDIPEVPEALASIERILMDESDDVGMSGIQEKDVNLDICNDFGSILDTDIFVNDTVVAESIQRELTFDGNKKEGVAGEVRRKDMEVNRSTLGGPDTKYHDHLPVDREISNLEEAMNQRSGSCLEFPQSNEGKLCKEEENKKLSELEGLTVAAQKRKKGEIVSIVDVVDSVGKSSESAIVTLRKTKKACLEDMISGIGGHMSMDGGSSNSSEVGGANSLTRVKMMDQKAHQNIEKSFTRKVKNSQIESKVVRYTREQLLHLRNMTSVSEDILEVLRETGADIHDKHFAVEETGDMNKEVQDFPTDVELAKENQMGSSILKKKRGSSSEARKEKKKRQKRKKRAEMNRKNGVKRLKLKPVLKPKVVPHCRHYLLGRCQEGEKCKFSHDVIPLTKSKPCCHFARNACMKGDDCPFNHQLSKYPCNNYVSTGFCVRGDSCLFSHKAPSTEGSNAVSSISNSETNSVLQLAESKSKLQLNTSTSLASGFAAANSPKEDSTRQTDQPVRVPKGVSFLSFGKSLAKDSAKHKEAEITQERIGDSAGTRGLPNITAGSGSKRNDDGTGTGNLNQGILKGAANVCQLFKGALTPISPKEIDLPASSGPSIANSSGKSQEATALPTNERTCSEITGKVTVNESDNLKTRQQEPRDFCTSVQFPADGAVRSTSIATPKALLSALSFAAKYESGMKMTSMSHSKDLNNNGGTKDNNGCKQNEESKASAILKFLYSGRNQKQ